MYRPIDIGIALVALLAVGASDVARAGEPDARPGLSFELTPYIWLPTIDTT